MVIIHQYALLQLIKSLYEFTDFATLVIHKGNNISDFLFLSWNTSKTIEQLTVKSIKSIRENVFLRPSLQKIIKLTYFNDVLFLEEKENSNNG